MCAEVIVSLLIIVENNYHCQVRIISLIINPFYVDLPAGKTFAPVMEEKLFCLSQQQNSLSDFNQYVMHHASKENIRNWAYILLSIGLFLRQDKAANL